MMNYNPAPASLCASSPFSYHLYLLYSRVGVGVGVPRGLSSFSQLGQEVAAQQSWSSSTGETGSSSVPGPTLWSPTLWPCVWEESLLCLNSLPVGK